MSKLSKPALAYSAIAAAARSGSRSLPLRSTSPLCQTPGTMRPTARPAATSVPPGNGGGLVTAASDTTSAAEALVRLNVDVILFAGGDGTARDILAAVGDRIPMLGIPSGVKMHSAVFAVSPEAAGQLAALIAGDAGGRIAWREAEVMDVDEAALRAGHLSAALFGYARAPVERHLVQGPKATGLADEAAIEGVTAEIAGGMEPGTLYLLGPGSSAKRILRHLGLEGTLLGVDAVRDGKILG